MTHTASDWNLAGAFYETCRRVPGSEFLQTEDDRTFTYEDVLGEVARVRAQLRDRGTAPGDRIMLSFPNCIELLASYIAVLSEGCVAVLVDPGSPVSHVDFVMRDSGAVLAVGSPNHPALRERDDALLLSIGDDLDRAPDVAPVGRSGDDPALIIYTSGTTGTPRGVLLTHANLRHTRDAIRDWARIRPTDRELTTLSLNHLFGLAHVHVYWSLGGFVRLHRRFGNIPALLESMSRCSITSFPSTPASIRILLDQFGGALTEHGKSLRYMIVNSAPLEPEYVKRLMAALPHVRVYMYYGLTEASRATYICYNDHPTKLETVGRPFPPCDVRIGADREIQVRGPNVTPGYWGQTPGTHLMNGWLPTGDVGEIDEDGFLTWRGRLKEQINVDGLKVTPSEIEAVVLNHPHVLEAAAFAMPDPLTGESVACAVVPREGAPSGLELEVRKFCRGKLQTYQIPKQVIVVEQLPKTDSGKVKRLALRQLLG